MTDMEITTAITGAWVWIGLLTAHAVADHWVQTSWQAVTKGLPGWPGRTACMAHVATYTLTTSVMVGFLWGLFNLDISPWGFITGQLVSAVTHYWADRRTTLTWLADLLGLSEFYRLGKPRNIVLHDLTGSGVPPNTKLDNPCLGTGAYALDQAWHKFWLFVAAILTVVV